MMMVLTAAFAQWCLGVFFLFVDIYNVMHKYNTTQQSSYRNPHIMSIPKYATIGAHSININAEFFLLLLSYLFFYYFTSACCVGTRCVNVAYYTFAQPMSYTLCAMRFTVHCEKTTWIINPYQWKAGLVLVGEYIYWRHNEDFGGGDMVVVVLRTSHGHQSATQQYHERHRTQHPVKPSANCFYFLFAFSSCCSG